jgi:type IV secretory pathway VirB4 component
MTPFSYESRFDPNGFFYGYHNYSGEPVIIDRTLGKSCHGFVLGSTGSGKGMFVKHEISNIVYQPFCKKDRIIVVDAVGEYVPLAEAFGGKIIDISPASDTHLNPLYLSRQREKELGTIKAQAEKSAFLIALLSLFKGDGGLTAAEKSAVDEACAAAYKQRNPTLETLSSELSKMGARGNSVATEMCIWLNRYTAGSVKLFTGEDTAHEDTECRFTVYDLKGLASGDLLDAAMLAMLERIEETVLQNFSEGVRTYIYIDELHRYFDAERNPYAAARLARFFSELRKFGAIITGITQLPKAVVASPDGSTMLSNSRFIVMAELDTHNADVVSELYDLNEDMRRTLAAPDVGQYVIRTSKAPMSVFLKYPGKEETERNLMYDLFNTSPDHGKNERGS